VEQLPEKEKEVVDKVKSVASSNVVILGPVDPPGATPKFSSQKLGDLIRARLAK
jgi:hypothetical protein